MKNTIFSLFYVLVKDQELAVSVTKGEQAQVVRPRAEPSSANLH